MLSIIKKNTNQLSYCECVEYIPLRIIFDSSIGNNRSICFYNGKQNLLELVADSETGILKKFQVVNCSSYSIQNSTLSIPKYWEQGSIQIYYSQTNYIEVFNLDIFVNGISLTISTNDAVNYYCMGQIIFGIDQNNDLSSIIITDLSSEEIQHTINELEF